jgi:hypothetical protein
MKKRKEVWNEEKEEESKTKKPHTNIFAIYLD